MSKLSLIPLFFLMACEGPPGPAGPVGGAGTAGTDGMDGAVGLDGTDGVDGADGVDGDAGADGQDLLAPTPDDVVFAFAVTNNSGGNHMGASPITLDFDGSAADATTVVSSFLDRPPLINGEDDGAAAWGGFESNVVFNRTGGTGNGSTGALLRAGYDDQYIYFFAQWKESTSDTGYGLSNERKQWTYDGSAWAKAGNEDRAFFMFPITTIAGWDAEGCQVACHAVGQNLETGEMTGWMNLNNPGELADVWHWKAARTGPAHRVDDKYMDDVEQPGDEGMSAYTEPKTNTGPAFQYATDPGANMGYPVWTWEMEPFDDAATYTAGDTIPGVINRTPSGSRADVTAVCRWTDATGSDGTWTCEFKRLRVTGNGDDRQF